MVPREKITHAPDWKLDATHPTVACLRLLLPEATVSGGSFEHVLPDLRDLAAEQRIHELTWALEGGSARCISDLLLNLQGFTAEVPRSSDGYRLWPAGFVGSLTHKGTVVLGALARKATLKWLGIDLERIQKGDRDLEPDEVAPEGLPGGCDQVSVATLLAFSAKEAVFKAQFPLLHKQIDFSDVRLTWRLLGEAHWEADACLLGGERLRVCSSITGSWVISAAVN